MKLLQINERSSENATKINLSKDEFFASHPMSIDVSARASNI